MCQTVEKTIKKIEVGRPTRIYSASFLSDLCLEVSVSASH